MFREVDDHIFSIHSCEMEQISKENQTLNSFVLKFGLKPEAHLHMTTPTLLCVTVPPQLNLGVATEDFTRTLSPTLISTSREKGSGSSSQRMKSFPEECESSFSKNVLTFCKYVVQFLLAENLQFGFKFRNHVTHITTKDDWL